MSAELNQRIDAARDKLLNLARQPFGFGNYKEGLREYQKLSLELINILDEVNGQVDKISQAQIDALKAAAAVHEEEQPT